MVQWDFLSHKGVSFPGKYKPITSLNPIVEEYLFYWYKTPSKLRKDHIYKNNFINSLSRLVTFDTSLMSSSSISKRLSMNKQPTYTRDVVSNVVKIQKNKQNFDFEINNCVPSPGIFIGRGSHPLRGNIKVRLKHEDVTLNISKSEKCPHGKWKSVIHNNECNYIAYWKDNLFNKYKYIIFPDISGEIDKYMKARTLHKKIDCIRRIYKKDLSSNDVKVRNLATCVYFIDNFLIRIGHDKDQETNSDTVGCCTLLVKHVHLNKNKSIEMKFLGKDSILYKKKYKLSDVVYQNVCEFMRNKTSDEALFSVSALSVNAYLNKLMPNLTAKVFRTCNATSIFISNLKKKSIKDLDTLNESFHDASTKLNHVKLYKNEYITEVSTAKLNYIDPRVVYSTCKTLNIDINKIYNNIMKKKHEWASHISKSFIY